MDVRPSRTHRAVPPEKVSESRSAGRPANPWSRTPRAGSSKRRAGARKRASQRRARAGGLQFSAAARKIAASKASTMPPPTPHGGGLLVSPVRNRAKRARTRIKTTRKGTLATALPGSWCAFPLVDNHKKRGGKTCKKHHPSPASGHPRLLAGSRQNQPEADGGGFFQRGEVEDTCDTAHGSEARQA